MLLFMKVGVDTDWHGGWMLLYPTVFPVPQICGWEVEFDITNTLWRLLGQNWPPFYGSYGAWPISGSSLSQNDNKMGQSVTRSKLKSFFFSKPLSWSAWGPKIRVNLGSFFERTRLLCNIKMTVSRETVSLFS